MPKLSVAVSTSNSFVLCFDLSLTVIYFICVPLCGLRDWSMFLYTTFLFCTIYFVSLSYPVFGTFLDLFWFFTICLFEFYIVIFWLL